MLHLHLDALGDQTLKMGGFAFFTVVDDSYYNAMRRMTRLAQQVTL
ncbi:MAG: hypothetical protein GY759_16340 [Chloroflexi bacterium]|nr:hypothetical protein [Chloroflexota bacterium]